MNKRELRKKFLEKRSSLDLKQLKKLNSNIFKRFIQSESYKKAKNIMIYISFDTEIDTHTIINHMLSDNKRVIVPITDSKNKRLIPSELHSMDELELGFYNILTPKEKFIRIFDKNDIDLVVVPGIVFDMEGYRVGYGGGYYDRFLKDLRESNTLSLCYDFQLIETLPRDDYDIAVNHVLTETRAINC